MSDAAAALLDQQGIVRLGVFAGLAVALVLFERLRPRRPHGPGLWSRRGANAALFGVDLVLVRFVAPAGLVGVAAAAQGARLGLFSVVEGPAWIEGVVAIVLLDLAVWAQHVAFHRVPLFWRFHAVHHADVDLDVSSGVRFHPGEMVLSYVWKAIAVVVLGAGPATVLVFEVLLNAMSLVTHANLGIAPRVDALLRRLVVTPDMHRIHHSARREETDSNYGFALSAWDRLFGTYRDGAQDGQLGLTIGLDAPRDPSATRTLLGVLAMPFGGGWRRWTA
ncbi:MAG: sterol desaturase family protein [Planctomycetota bacterium]